MVGPEQIAMLDLASPRWSELQQCYGPATEVPKQLAELLRSENCEDDPHSLLFGQLCHQGATVYTATYAAVPHVVSALLSRQLRGQIQLLSFLGQAIATRDRPPVPADLADSYDAAIEALKPQAVSIAKRRDIDAVDYPYVLSAIPGVYGLEAAQLIVEWFLANDEIIGLCKHCRSNLHVLQTDLPLVVRPGTDTDDEAGDEASEVTPAPLPTEKWDGTVRDDNALVWLAALATEAGQTEIVVKISALFGTLSCPSCQQAICLWDAAVADGNPTDDDG